MGLLSDALRHLLATDPAERRAGLAGLVGRAFGAEPVRVRHPEAPAVSEVDVVHYPKAGASHTRSFAATLTLGLGEPSGRELLALTLADSRDPERDRVAWMLVGIAALGPARGAVVPLPAGCLGRSSHTHVVLTEAFVLPDRDRPDYERIVGARLDLCIPITRREAEWIEAHGVDAYLAAMKEQGVGAHADRPAGETQLR
jgi:hypothetical protein